jgi:hypothetical protein
MNEFGTITIMKSGHLRQTTKYGGKLIHRLIMEKYIGRELNRNEIVHHIDGNPINNSLDNLKIMTQSEHMSLHVIRKGIYKNGNSSDYRICTRCRKKLPLNREFFSPKNGSPLGFHYYCKKCRAEIRKEKK